MASYRAISGILAGLAFTATLTACGGGAGDSATDEVAASDEPEILKIRHDNFEEIGDAFKAVRGQLESGSPDFDVIVENAEIIKTNAAKVKDHFPAGTGIDAGYDTEALPTIWEKPDEFAAAAQELEAKSDEFMVAVLSGDIAKVGAAAEDLGGSCKNCHDTFRVKEDD